MTRARKLANLGNQNAFTVDSGSLNVGIGSTRPDYKLDVDGTAFVGGGVTISGNLSVGGTVTYEDVTNVDAVGIITANSGVNIVGGGLTVTGVGTFFSGANIVGGGLTVTGVGTFFSDVLVGRTSVIDEARLTIAKSAAGFTTAIALHNADTDGIGSKIVSTRSLVLGADTDNNTGVSGSLIAFETNGTEKVRIKSGGNVGIGTTNPTELLEIVSTSTCGIAIKDGDNGFAASKIKVENGGRDLSIGAPQDIIFKDIDTGTSHLYIESGGNVGIGTAAPSKPLHVYHATTNEIARFQSGDATCYISFRDSDSNATATNRPILGAKGDNMFLQTGGSERVRIDSAGRLLVGIDTAMTTASNDHRDTIQAVDTAGAQLLLARNDTATVTSNRLGEIAALGNDADGTYQVGGSIRFEADANHGDDDKPTRILFKTCADGSATPTERLRINSTGRVLIGTGAVGAASNLVAEGGLQVSTNGASGAPTVCFGADGTAANTQTITDNTIKDFRMGFPNYDIQEEPLAAMCGFVGDGSSDDDNDAGRLYIGGGTSWMNAVNHIRFFTAPSNLTTVTGTERLRITGIGSVGIGLTNPDTTLHLATNSSPAQGTNYAALSLGSPTQSLRKVEIGARRSTSGSDWDHLGIGFKVHASNDHTVAPELKMVLDYNGYLGIGTDNPGSPLQVQDGDIKIQNNAAGSDGVFIRNATSTFAWTGQHENSNIPNGAVGLIIDNADVATNNTVALAEFRTYRNSATSNPGVVYIGAVDIGDGSTHSADCIFALKDGSATVKERMRITHDGYIGINSATPGDLLEIHPSTNNSGLTFKDHGNTYPAITFNCNRDTEDAFLGNIRAHWDGTAVANILFETGSDTGNKDNGVITFRTATAGSPSERMRIHEDGTLSVMTGNKSTYDDDVQGSAGLVVNGGSRYTSVARWQGTPLFVNRMSQDGNLISFYESGSVVGAIAVSGNTTSYNPFLGCHKGRLSDGSKPTILTGTIVENINQSIEWKTATISNVGSASSTVVIPYYGAKTSGTDTVQYGGLSYTGTVGFSSNYQPTGDNKHVCVKVSDTASSKAVGGVFVGWDGNASDAKDNHLDEPYNDLRVGGVGNFFIRMKSGETVANGDLVESNGDGTGKVQSDDIIRSKTVGKITSTNVIKTYDDGSFLVTAVLYAG